MRILLVVWLASTAATAAELKGRVVYKGEPVAKAEVRVFKVLTALEGCAPNGGTFGRCVCPEGHDAFRARLLTGFQPSPLATTTSGADGAFSVPVAGPGPWSALAVSADGALAAQVTLKEEGGDVPLFDSQPVRFKLAGLWVGAVAWLFDPSTLTALAFSEVNGEWSSGPTPAGMHDLVIASPGSQVVMMMTIDGRLIHLMSMPPGEVPTITLAAPQNIIGAVVDEKGRPVAGVDVIADADQCAVKTKTNAKGEFTLTALRSAPYSTALVATVGGKVARRYAQPGDNSELQLRKAAHLELTFVDKRGKPIQGVDARLSGPHVPNLQQKSDATGKWNEGDLYEEEVQLGVPAPWILTGDRKLLVKGSTKRVVVLEKGVALSGRLLDARGAPAPGVLMSIFYGDALLTQVSDSMKDALQERGVFTDAKGEFTFLVLPGQYEVVANRNRSSEIAAVGTAPGRMEVKLAAGALITGSVVGPDGKPIASANIHVTRQDLPNRAWAAASNTRGQFEVEVTGPGTYEVSVSREGTGAEKKLLVELGSAGAKPLKVQLEVAPRLRGSVVDSSGKPLAKVVVEAVSTAFPQLMMMQLNPQPKVDPATFVPMAKMMNLYFQATTAADGTFELQLAAEALLFVQVEGLGADVVKASPAAPAKIVLAPRSVARGRLVDFSGRPVGHFWLNAKEIHDPDGRFVLTLPSLGPLPVRIAADPAPIEKRTIEVPAKICTVDLGDLKLRKGFVVSGHVLLAGKPVSAAFLVATSKDGEVEGSAVQQDGSFSYHGVPEGTLELVLTANDYAGTTVSVKAGDRNVELALQRFASLLVRAAPDTSVKLIGPPRGAAKNERSVKVGPEGELNVDQLDPGEWTVQVDNGPSKKVKLAPDQKGNIAL